MFVVRVRLRPRSSCSLFVFVFVFVFVLVFVFIFIFVFVLVFVFVCVPSLCTMDCAVGTRAVHQARVESVSEACPLADMSRREIVLTGAASCQRTSLIK